MIGYIQGQILKLKEDEVLLGVGFSSGKLGYEVRVPRRTLLQFPVVGKNVELFIYTHVREDQLELFGFQSEDEKEFFLALLQVNGVGPKSALGILSENEPKNILHSILNEEVALLQKLPGVGKKTAERLVVELSDKLQKRIQHGEFSEWMKDSPKKSMMTTVRSRSSENRTVFSVEVKEVVIALQSLGYRESDAQNMTMKAFEKMNSTQVRVEDLLKASLKENTMGL